MKLIIGLGNPGKEYEKTRHNVGFRVADELAGQLDETWSFSEKFKAYLLPPTSYILAKPQTFMNLSGQSVSSLIRFYKLNAATDLLVISDDKDMQFGKLRLRDEGSSGGHNGLASIIEHLGTEQFHRLKIGVGHPEQKVPTDAFVLQKFSAEEEKQLPEIISEAVEKIQAWFSKPKT